MVCDTYLAQRLAISRSKAANRLELRAVLQTTLVASFVQRGGFDTLGQRFSERLEIDSAIVGVILTYITDGMPQQVEVDWELFTDQIQRVPATATEALHAHWPGSELRRIPGGHATLLWFHKGAFATAIADSFDRLVSVGPTHSS